MRPFCRKSHVHKIPRFRGGGYFGFWGGGVPILFLWAGGFFWKNWLHNKVLEAIVHFCGYFFLFPGQAKTYIFLFFPISVAGQRGRNSH